MQIADKETHTVHRDT